MITNLLILFPNCAPADKKKGTEAPVILTDSINNLRKIYSEVEIKNQPWSISEHGANNSVMIHLSVHNQSDSVLARIVAQVDVFDAHKNCIGWLFFDENGEFYNKGKRSIHASCSKSTGSDFNAEKNIYNFTRFTNTVKPSILSANKDSVYFMLNALTIYLRSGASWSEKLTPKRIAGTSY